jgi:hypothetical protein
LSGGELALAIVLLLGGLPGSDHVLIGVVPQTEFKVRVNGVELSSSEAMMRRIKSNSQGGRLTRVLVRAYPSGKWCAGREDFGDDFYTARNRFGDTLAPRGINVASRRRESDISEGRSKLYEWRLASEVDFHEAALLVRSWDTGEDLETLRANDSLLARARAAAAARAADTQGRLGF